MVGHMVQAAGNVISLTQSDVDSIAPRQRGPKGRRRFATGCVHRDAYKQETGEDYAEDSCPKFAHLPGNGRGPQSPGIFRTVRGIAISFVKPLFYFGLIYCAYLLLSGFLGNLSFGNFVPGSNGGVPNSTQHKSTGNVPANPGSNTSIPSVGNSRPTNPVVIPHG